jgi:hypothetical protein
MGFLLVWDLLSGDLFSDFAVFWLGLHSLAAVRMAFLEPVSSDYLRTVPYL